MSNGTQETPGPGNMAEMEEGRLRNRLLAVEREAEWLRTRVKILGIGLLVTLGLGGIGAFSQGFPIAGGRVENVDLLRAQRIVLEDAVGIPRGEWGIDGDGKVWLGLLDRQGRARLRLSVLGGGSPGLSMINANGRPRAALGLLPDESTSLVFADGSGVPRAVLGLSSGDAAQLVFADASSVQRVAIGLDEAGIGNIILPEDSVEAPLGPAGGGR